jgi:hypothetical protein
MLVLLGYVFDNIVRIQSEIYQPLRDATVPLVVARNALKRKSINASIDAIAPESEFQDFLKDDTMIKIAQYTLNEECSTVIGEAAEVHQIFQLFVAGILAEGSPSILLFMFWKIITINGVLTLWKWLPKQIPIFKKWFVSGMVKPLNTNKMWADFKPLIPLNLLFVTEYFAQNWLIIDHYGVLDKYQSIAFVCIGLLVIFVTQYETISNGSCKSMGLVVGIGFFILTPLLIWVVGSLMFVGLIPWLIAFYWLGDDESPWSYVIYLFFSGQFIIVPTKKAKEYFIAKAKAKALANVRRSSAKKWKSAKRKLSSVAAFTAQRNNH